jgi:hypothetical protein
MMMDTFEAIEQRRSIKSFDATHHMPDQDVQTLMSAVLKTPPLLTFKTIVLW